MAYGKVFESLYTGSMVGSGLGVFAVWTYCIANAKPPGTIELNPKIMATIFGCQIIEVESCIAKLCEPDPYSRSKEHDGRRLVKEGEFLYFIPTWEKYNQLRNEIARRQQNRDAQRRWREKQRNADVSMDKQNKPMQMQTHTPNAATTTASGSVPVRTVRRRQKQSGGGGSEVVPEDREMLSKLFGGGGGDG